MKRRQRRPVLEIKGQAGSQGEYLESKFKQISSDYPSENAPANPLANLLCHYDSDSDTEDSKKDSNKLDDQVNNFFKEIQLIAPKGSVSNNCNNAAFSGNASTQSSHQSSQTAQLWQECVDESTGYPYYWHIETNEVTWEMPEELRALKNDLKMNSAAKQPAVQESRWMDFSSMSYQQAHENIPEGMIPREVVARNRNRYIRNEAIKRKEESKNNQDTANNSDPNDDEFDEGRIEMITSYGSEESDSDATENNHSSTDPTTVATSESTIINTFSTTKHKTIETQLSPAPVILPELPKSCLKQAQKCEVRNSSIDSREDTSESIPSQEAITNEGRVQLAAEENSETTKISAVTVLSEDDVGKEDNKKCAEEVDFRVSLVPGYDEDSDVEEEPENKHERCALFPIPQNEVANDKISLLPKSGVCIQRTLFDTVNSDNDNSAEKKNVGGIEHENSVEKVESEDVKVDEEKCNMFLDSSRRNKCFQRKKRIAFDVPSAKVKTNGDNEIGKLGTESKSEVNTNITEDADPPKEAEEDNPKESNEVLEDSQLEDPVKNESNLTVEDAGPRSNASCESKEEDEQELNSLSQIIQEKLKFLSEGKPSVSPVETMAIQLQTLFVAWEGGYLEKGYLRRWLSDTSRELERLEQDAAPPGWLCQWDRSHKRYYYQNSTSGITQWTYPDTGIAGGTEEMEICSTPPPSEQEEISAPGFIGSTIEPGIKKPPTASKAEQSNEDLGIVGRTPETRSTDIEAPPPPQISNPSPPPPPRIFAEDLMNDKKRRDKCNDKQSFKKKRLGEGPTISEAKQLETPLVSSILTTTQASLSPQPAIVSSITNTEPLPPGVDIPEASPYEIPATALKRIIYNSVQQQNTALFEASAADPTVSILGHPAIVQEHYLQYPAYHQHLHAQPAAIVLPHKHPVQPAIQLIPDYTPIYTNRKVIVKPPVKTQKESLVSALDSFYNDIARIEKSGPEPATQRQEIPVVENISAPAEEVKSEVEPEQSVSETAVKEKKRKKTRIGISKKHKEMSSMVAKWQKVQQNFEDNT